MRAHRVRRLLLGAAGILALGLGYAAFIHLTGWAVPCLFRQVTGLKCPGCGVTSMCLALLRLDFAAAFRWNPGLMVIVGDERGRCTRFSISPERMASEIKQHLSRNLTKEEWQYYIGELAEYEAYR